MSQPPSDMPDVERAAFYRRERLKEEALAAALKPPAERSEAEWTLLAFTPAPIGTMPGCHHEG